jgi:hypothetical protein
MYAIYSGTSSVNSSNVGHVVSFEANWTPLSLSFVSSGCYWSLSSHQSDFRDLRMPLCPSLTHNRTSVRKGDSLDTVSLRRFPICKRFRCFYTISGVHAHRTSGRYSLWSSLCSALEAFVILGETTTIRGRQIRYVRQPVRFAMLLCRYSVILCTSPLSWFFRNDHMDHMGCFICPETSPGLSSPPGEVIGQDA